MQCESKLMCHMHRQNLNKTENILMTTAKPQPGGAEWQKRQRSTRHRQQAAQTTESHRPEEEGVRACRIQSANHRHHKTDTTISTTSTTITTSSSSSSIAVISPLCARSVIICIKIYMQRSKQNSLAINYENTLNR